MRWDVGWVVQQALRDVLEVYVFLKAGMDVRARRLTLLDHKVIHVDSVTAQ
jgi:hypothetical protein